MEELPCQWEDQLHQKLPIPAMKGLLKAVIPCVPVNLMANGQEVNPHVQVNNCIYTINNITAPTLTSMQLSTNY